MNLFDNSTPAQRESAEELKKLNETLTRVEKNTSTRQQFKTTFFSAALAAILVAILVAVFNKIIRHFS